MGFLRPEDRNNLRQQVQLENELDKLRIQNRLYTRPTRYLERVIFKSNYKDKWLQAHGQRMNYYRFVPIVAASFWCGSMFFYYLWKT